MDDDFNTPEAIAALQGLVTEINRAKSANEWGKASALAAELKKLAAVLGVLHLQPEEFLRKGKPGLADADVERLIGERRAARAARNYKESDRIRNELAQAGIVLEDKPDGTTTWRRG
jgi:cysteinyl-tRNA synthetase